MSTPIYTPRAGSVADRVIRFLADNPDEVLSAADIADLRDERRYSGLGVAEAVPLRGPADIYHVLPYRPRMRALVSPKGAWVAPTSLVSSITDRAEPESRVPLRALRRWALFYDVVDWLRGDLRKKQRRIDAMVAEGTLPPGHDWRAMPTGRRMLFE